MICEASLPKARKSKAERRAEQRAWAWYIENEPQFHSMAQNFARGDADLRQEIEDAVLPRLPRIAAKYDPARGVAFAAYMFVFVRYWMWKFRNKHFNRRGCREDRRAMLFEHFGRDMAGEPAELIPDQGESPEAAVDRYDEILGAIRGMSVREAGLILLRSVFDLPFAEIGRQLGSCKGTVFHGYHRAADKLKQAAGVLPVPGVGTVSV